MVTATPRLDLAELYGPEAVAAVLKVSKATVYRLIHDGELFAHKIGSQFRIPGWAVFKYLGIETGQLAEPAAA